MPAMLRFDTLKFAKRLTDAGMDPRQAEAIVLGLSETDVSELASKADTAEVRGEIADLGTDLKAEIAGVRGGIADLGKDLRTEIAGVRGETADLRTELRTEIAGVKGEIGDLRTELRTEIAGVRGEMGGLKAELFRFMYLQAMGVVGLTVASPSRSSSSSRAEPTVPPHDR